MENNAKCEWCGKEYRLPPHQLNRKKLEGRATCCSKSCGRYYHHNKRVAEKERQEKANREAERLDWWMAGFDSGYTQAKHEYYKEEQ